MLVGIRIFCVTFVLLIGFVIELLGDFVPEARRFAV